MGIEEEVGSREKEVVTGFLHHSPSFVRTVKH